MCNRCVFRGEQDFSSLPLQAHDRLKRLFFFQRIKQMYCIFSSHNEVQVLFSDHMLDLLLIAENTQYVAG